ncbi:MAG: ABC transporter substrate-binding protein [Vallitalea sp.]|jgi:iron complex transport system substrate-binding protein|nr:ABC transporter substrate-binding protein [Vallitalea sp.]
MKKSRIIAMFLVTLLLTTSIIGCGQKQVSSTENTTTNSDSNIENQPADINDETEKLPDFIINETDTSVTYVNPLDEEVTITKNPKKVIVLMNSILDIWYLAGGEAIARVSGTTNVPEAAIDIAQVGKVNGPSIEKILELQPDLVILSSTRSQHVEMKEILADNDIELAYVDISNDPYKRFNDTLKLFTMITDRDDIYNTRINEIQTKVDEICSKVQEEKQPSVVILFGSTKYVKAELPCGLVGNMVELFGAKNIIQGSPIEGSSKIDFSLETIIKEDPDVVLIVTMGDIDKVKERLNSDIESNEAWATLSAVKNKRVFYLPNELFHYKPNARYPEAFQYLGELLYPQVFKK